MTAKTADRIQGRSRDAEVARLIGRSRDGERAARDELFERFFPLARRLAGRYPNPYEPREDLVQVAAVALLGAIDRFEPGRGIPFEAFAIPTILGELKRHYRATGWSAHVPRSAQELAQRVRGAQREIAERGGPVATVGEIAERLGLDVDDVLTGLRAAHAHYAVSFDAPVASDDNVTATLADAIGRAEEGYDLVDSKLSVTAALSRIPHQERTALRLRYERDLRQRDIADLMGCSQMQVSRLLRRASVRVRTLADPDLPMRT